MKEKFDIQVLNYLKDKFPNHKESDYLEAAVYLCCLLIIERDSQIQTIIRKGTRK